MMESWWSLAVLVCLLQVSGGQPVHTVETCTSTTPSRLTLTCETGEMLHVISVQYQNMTPSCESPPGASCVFLQETQADSLYTDCNGVATCEMEVQRFWVDNVCGETTTYQATISYECVSDDPVDVCDIVTHLSRENDSRLYLASPNYPHGTSSAADTCTCDVTGGDMNVTVLEYYFDQLEGVRANLTLTRDTTTWESFTAGILAYNSLVMGNTNRLRIVFDPTPTSAKKREFMWLKVEGSSTLHVSCNGSPPPTTITPGTTATTIEGSFSSFSTSNTTVAVASSSPDRVQGTDDGSNTVAVAVGCVFAVIVVAAIVIIVVFILLRRKRLKPYLSSTEKLDNECGDAGGSKEDEAHEMPRYVTDVPYCTTADQIRRPLSTEYAELDAHRSIKVDNVKVSVTKLDGRDNSSSSNGTPGSIVPYTSKRLEELYAKVIPTKFRSTKNREVEDKSVRDESVRDSALDCDNGSVEQVTKQRPVSKGGRHFSEPDYQEIGDISNSQPVPETNSQQGPPVFLPHPPLSPSSDQVPPVPGTSEAAFQRLEEVKSDDKGTKIKKERRKSTDSYVSSKEKKRKKRKERSPKSEKEKSTIQYEEIEIPANPANAFTSPSTDFSNQDDVIVENPLYEGGPADDELTESPGDQRPLSEHYEDIRSDAHSAQTHVNIDMNPGRPPPYEEVTI
ncbi:uncharacterized protein LOC124112371 isoform X2 [Haliotis rufescens]|uniref:uncharacterized protein LOC124112371 isoform X2 n=1 Tax=Haliotis rufescens TaxID=6454 RepID=UPI00201F8362|nr:uncharacterized protein LOC124112371 isoform X2 [Haliotis rufescens]